MLSVLLPTVAPQRLPEVGAGVLQWLLQQKQQQQQQLGFATVSSAALVFEALRARLDAPGGFSSSSSSTGDVNGADASAAAAAAAAKTAKELLSVQQLPGVISVVLPTLVAPQQEVRAAALRLLCCFEQPPFTTSSSQQQQQQEQKPGHERAAFEGMRCDVLCVLRDMHTQPCSIQAGRSWSVALDRMTNHLEYGRVPLLLLPAIAGALLGVLHIRWVVVRGCVGGWVGGGDLLVGGATGVGWVILCGLSRGKGGKSNLVSGVSR
jgi:U3 small nucleolar RNA-associated protein 20